MNSEPNTNQCKNCSRPVKGRSDKQFCNDNCRNSFHNVRNQLDNNFTRNISGVLKRNRSKLKELFGKGLTVVSYAKLDACKFDRDYHTHSKAATNGSVTTFCFDFGYQILPNNKIKIIHQTQT